MPDSEVLEELRQIRWHLGILTFEVRSQALQSFENEVLQTENRAKMFSELDGQRTTTQVAAQVHVSGRAVRDLLRDMAQFLTIRMQGAAQIAEPNWEAILDWYFRRPA